MQYEVPQRPSAVLSPPIFDPASQWRDTKFQNVVPYVPNTMGNIANSLSGILPNALALKQKMLQIPVQEAQAKTELEQQKLAQIRLDRLNANPNMIPITTTVGPNAAVSVTPMAMSDYDAFTGLSKYGPIPTQTGGVSNRSQTDTTNTGDSTTEQKPNASDTETPSGLPSQGGVPAPPVSQNPNVYGPSFPEAPAPVQPPVKKTSQTSPTPADAVASNGPPYSPSEILDLYQKQFDSRAKHARAEMSMASGNPTGRTIILGDPKLGIPDQPIHPEWVDKYLADNPGAWSPDRSANAPVNLTMASGNVDGAQAVDQANDLSTKLATNTLTPSDVLNAGGPLWTAANHGPQAPLPQNGVQPLRSQSGGQVFPPRGLIQKAQPVVSNNKIQSQAPSIKPPIDAPDPKSIDAPNDDLYWQHHTGMTMDQFGKTFSNPNNYKIVGQSSTVPLPGQGVLAQPSKIGVFTNQKTGKTETAFVEPGSGMPYYTHYQTPYKELRYLADGKVVPVENVINEENDKKMMDFSIENGTGGPDWQNWSRDQKIQAYQQAAAIKNGIHDPGFNEKLLSMDNVIDQAQTLRDQLASYSAAHPDDPGAVHVRNLLNVIAASNIASYGGLLPQKWSDYIKTHSGGMIDPSHPNDDVRRMTMTYEALKQAARENQGGEHAPDQGPRQFRQEANIPGLPAFSDTDFSDRLNEYINRQHLAYENRVDAGIAQRIQIPYSASQRIGTWKFGANSASIPGANTNNPIQVTSPEQFDKIPNGTAFRDQEGVKIKGQNLRNQ